ncbi:ABC transporter substrate-binding protein [Pseudalkalibacillus sp. A8]|uniref:ABC transporter substrate-binding protein n=1 Tax=Pseudalkalibacillus sp. A8 TaxID=3382641 RepID=UPI0038B559FF
MVRRKIVQFVIVLTLIFSLGISGCSWGSSESSGNTNAKDNGDKPYAGTTIRIMVTPGTGQYNAWKSRTKEFTQKTGIKVEFVDVSFSKMLEKITTDGISAKGYYDLVNFMGMWGPSIQQFLQPLDEYIEKDDFDLSRWPDVFVEGASFGGHVYGLPMRGHPQMLFYRKDTFKQLNLKKPETWNEVVEMGSKVVENTNQSGIVPYYGRGNNGQNLFMWTAYLWSNGGNIFDEDWKPVFNSKQGVEATKRYIDLLLKHNIAPTGSISFNEQDAMNHFSQGKSAMWLGWWWAYGTFNNKEVLASEVVGNVGYSSVPKWEGKESVANALTFPTGIMKASKNKEAAWEYLKWLASPEMDLGIAMDSLTNKSAAKEHSIVVTQVNSLKNEKLNELTDGMYKVALKNLENARTLPQIKVWPKVASILSTAISEMASGAPVEKTLNDAQKQVKEVMERGGYYK